MENGSSSRHRKCVPAVAVWNRGRPVRTLMDSGIHEDKPAGNHIGGE